MSENSPHKRDQETATVTVVAEGFRSRHGHFRFCIGRATLGEGIMQNFAARVCIVSKTNSEILLTCEFMTLALKDDWLTSRLISIFKINNNNSIPDTDIPV